VCEAKKEIEKIFSFLHEKMREKELGKERRVVEIPRKNLIYPVTGLTAEQKKRKEKENTSGYLNVDTRVLVCLLRTFDCGSAVRPVTG